MAWSYSDYITETNSTSKYTKLKSHVKEVVDELSDVQSMTIDGMSSSRFALESYLKQIKKELAELESALGVGSAKRRYMWARGRFK